MNVSKFYVNAVVEAPKSLSFVKRTSIAVYFMDSVNCVEDLVVAWVLAGFFLAGIISVRFIAFWPDRLAFGGSIGGLEGVWYWLASRTTSFPKALIVATYFGLCV